MAELTVLDVWDHKTGNLFSVYCRQKGPEDNYQADAMKNFISQELGWGRVLMRPGGESSLVALTEKIAKQREQPTVVKPSPEGSPQTIGGAEGAHSRTFATIR